MLTNTSLLGAQEVSPFYLYGGGVRVPVPAIRLKLPAPRPADSLLGALPRLNRHDSDALASSARRHPVGALLLSRSQKHDRAVHHAPVRADGSRPSCGSPGSALYVGGLLANGWTPCDTSSGSS